MDMPIKYKEHFEVISKDMKYTMRDEKTKLVIQSKGVLYVIEVDKGILKNKLEQNNQVKANDYLVYDEENSQSHLFELKGSKIDTSEPFDQILSGIKHIQEDKELAFLLRNKLAVDAYIVSPQRQQIPKNISRGHRMLAKKLASLSGKRFDNVFSLIKFVKVIPKAKNAVLSGNTIICSAVTPILL